MTPSNDEMKQTKPAKARMTRSSLLIRVLDGFRAGLVGFNTALRCSKNRMENRLAVAQPQS